LKITTIEIIESLIELELKNIKKDPSALKSRLYEGFIGYQHFHFSDLARMYDEAYSKKTRGHVQVVDPANPKVILAEYSRLIVKHEDKKKYKFKLLKGGKK